MMRRPSIADISSVAVRQQLGFARRDMGHAERSTGSRPPRPGRRSRRCSGVPASNWCGGIVEHGAVEADFLDHLAATEERRHRLQVLAPRPQRAGAGRAAHLVAGEGIEVAADRRDVDRACAAPPASRRPRSRCRACALRGRSSRTGLMVPSTLLTWVTPSSLTSGVIAAHSASRSSAPSGVISATLIVAPVRSATSCHGTMLAWCSIRVSRIASPAAAAAAPTHTRPG